MSDYAYDGLDYQDEEDPEYDADDYDDSEMLDRLAALEAENARLRAQVGRAPPKPVQDINAALASARTQEEAMAMIDEHNAAIAASMPAPEVPEIDHEALQANIRAAQSPEVVMALLHAGGIPTDMNPGGDY